MFFHGVGVVWLLDVLVKARKTLCLHFENTRLEDLLLRSRVVHDLRVDSNLLCLFVQTLVKVFRS